MTEYQKTYIELKKQFVATNEGPDSVRALYTLSLIHICGGLGPFLGFLPCSPHCKPEVQEDNELNGDYDFYRPIIRLENYD